LGKYALEPGEEKRRSTRVETRGIASLQYKILPPGAKGYFEEIRAAKGLIVNRHVTPKGSGMKWIIFLGRVPILA